MKTLNDWLRDNFYLWFAVLELIGIGLLAYIAFKG